MTSPSPRPVPPIEVELPTLDRWAAGNCGVPFVWRFASPRPGPTVLVQALTHGNEVCGAIALDWLLGTGFRPERGTFVGVFANVDAYLAFDPADPFASRCLDEDFNRAVVRRRCSTARANRASSPAPARCARSSTRRTSCSTCTR